VSLTPTPRESYPAPASTDDARAFGVPAEAAEAAADYARSVQIEERGFGMSRDLAQAGVNATICGRLGETADLIRRNNAEAE
jgi:hypothetical protein